MQTEIEKKLKKFAVIMVVCQFIGMISLFLATMTYSPLKLAITMGLGGAFISLGLIIYLGSLFYDLKRSMKIMDRLESKNKS